MYKVTLKPGLIDHSRKMFFASCQQKHTGKTFTKIKRIFVAGPFSLAYDPARGQILAGICIFIP